MWGLSTYMIHILQGKKHARNKVGRIIFDRESHPGGHHWDYCPGVLSEVKCLQFIWNGTPVDFIYIEICF